MNLSQCTERYQRSIENERQAFEAVKLANQLLKEAVAQLVADRSAMLDAWNDYTHGTGTTTG